MKMRIPIISVLVMLVTSYAANAQQTVTNVPLTIIGDALPPIRHITDMKITGDTLWFVYETEDGFGQRFLRKASIDKANNTLQMGGEIGRKAGGYYMSNMPYPVNGSVGEMQVVSQDDGEIFRVVNDSLLSRTKKFILSGSSTLPFPLSQYVQDVTMVSPDKYVFMGREPNGGAQYAMKANVSTAEIDTIRRIQFSPDISSWLPNTGELVYSKANNRFAFAYRMHPIIDIFGMDGNLIKQVRIGSDTFNPATLDEADFEELNPLHIVDITANLEYIFALHWSCKYSEADTTPPIIYKIDWAGNIIDRIFNIPTPLYKIAAGNDNYLIGWNRKFFISKFDEDI